MAQERGPLRRWPLGPRSAGLVGVALAALRFKDLSAMHIAAKKLARRGSADVPKSRGAIRRKSAIAARLGLLVAEMVVGSDFFSRERDFFSRDRDCGG